MSGDPAAAESLLQKKLAFSIIQYLNDISSKAPEGVDVESLEVATQCLGQAFALDVSDEEQKKQHAIGTSLDQIFKYGLVLDSTEGTPLSAMLKNALNVDPNSKVEVKTPEQSLYSFYNYIYHITNLIQFE